MTGRVEICLSPAIFPLVKQTSPHSNRSRAAIIKRNYQIIKLLANGAETTGRFIRNFGFTVAKKAKILHQRRYNFNPSLLFLLLQLPVLIY
jgi:hypothetical protein